MKKRLIALLAAPLLAIMLLALTINITAPAAIGKVNAAISLNSTYTQNFDSLANTGTANPWADDSTLAGWYAARATGGTFTTYRADAGTSNTGALYSYGITNTTDRALGSLSSGTPLTIYYGLRMQNDTNVNVTGFVITYTGEEWRQGGNTAQQKLAFAYQVGSVVTNVITGTWTDVNQLDFVSPITSSIGITGPLDGNAAANRVALAAQLTVTVPPNNEIMFRWMDINDVGNDHGLAVDDLTIVPIKEVVPLAADLGVAKSGPTTASAGDPINYTITISNSGTTTATSTLVTDTLPVEVNFVTYTTALPVNFSQPDNQTLVWDLGDLANGASGSITVQGVISASVTGGTLLTNTVTASTTATETATTNNTATATTLIGAPDLVLVKTGPASAMAGDQVAYTLDYSNTGDLNAPNVVLVDQLPAGLSYVSDSLGNGVQVGGRITWTLGTVPVNAAGSVVLTATAVSVGDQVNTAVIGGSSADSNPQDNTSVFTTTVLGSDPFVSKTGPTVVFGGELISYTIVYGNHGSAPADVTLTDTLPISFTTSDIAFDNSGLAPIDSATTRSWTATLAAGDRFTFTLALTVPTSIATNTRITNTLAITTNSLGNNPIDDLSSASSTVYQIVPIATARAGSNGQVFAVEGNVTVVPATFSAGEWELQDDTGGITAFYTPAPTIALGDRVRLVGVFDNSFGAQPELSSPRYFANLGPGITPAPKLYTTGQVVAGSSQGWLVTISGTLASLTNCSGNYHLAVNDGSGAADVFINAYSNPAINPCGRGFANGDWVQVTGFSTVFSPTYEVRPRMASDLVQYPRVLSVSPVNGAIEVPLAATITATFNTTLTNVSGSTFLLQGPSGAVAGTVASNPATKTAVFTPTAPLAANTLYTATLKASLAASNGLTLMPAQDYVWSFRTHQPTPDLSTSTKVNSVNGAVLAGQWVTYTITLNNTGDGDATAVITDVLGSYYGVARPLDFTQPTTGTLTWSGIVTAGQSVTLQFVAQVKGPQALPQGSQLLMNSAQINDGMHAPFTVDDPMPPTITIYSVYLPLIKR